MHVFVCVFVRPYIFTWWDFVGMALVWFMHCIQIDCQCWCVLFSFSYFTTTISIFVWWHFILSHQITFLRWPKMRSNTRPIVVCVCVCSEVRVRLCLSIHFIVLPSLGKQIWKRVDICIHHDPVQRAAQAWPFFCCSGRMIHMFTRAVLARSVFSSTSVW